MLSFDTSMFSKNITLPNINSLASTDISKIMNASSGSVYSNQEYESQTQAVSTKVQLQIYLSNQELCNQINMTVFVNENKLL